MMRLRYFLIILFVFGPLLTMTSALRATEASDGDAIRGAKLYGSRCGACHSLVQNRVGPRHAALFGRRAGTQPGYDYSQALQESDLVWDDASLDRWLTNPQALIPGQKMGFRVRKAEDRADIIVFLRSLKSAADSSSK